MNRPVSRAQRPKFSTDYASGILRQAEHRLRLTLDMLLEGCQIIGFDWTYLYLNEAAATHGRKKREELLGKSILTEYPGIERTELFVALRRCMEQRKPERMDTEFVFPDGTVGWFELSIQPVPEGIFVLSMDVTGDRRREEALRQSEELFRLMSENVGDLITLVDPDGRRIYDSPSVRELLGDPADLVGTDAFREVHPEDRDRVRSAFFEMVRSGRGARAEYRLLLENGRVRHVESNADPVRGRDGRVYRVVIVSRDVTERKQIEEQYLRSQRLESIGNLAGGIAHDLNNILTPILASIDSLRLKPGGKRAGAILDTLESSARRGAEMVNQVVSFARGSDPGPAPIRIDRVVGEAMRLVSMSFPKTIAVKADIPPGLWPVSGDTTQIHQVLMNLLVNAKDALPSGGAIAIGAANTTVTRRNAAGHPGVKFGLYVTIAISDNGTGIPEAIRDRIFEPFFTTKAPDRGTGLGLSTTRSILRAHGGFVTVESVVGCGTTFRIYLPMDQSAAEAPKPSGPAELPHGRGEVVLVVDDETAIREMLRTTLEAYGYATIGADDGAETVQVYADAGRHIDLVITDIVMPFMDGHAVIRELRKLNPAVKVLGISALMTGDYRRKYPDRDGIRFLAKPYTTESLLKTVRGMLDQGPRHERGS